MKIEIWEIVFKIKEEEKKKDMWPKGGNANHAYDPRGATGIVL